MTQRHLGARAVVLGGSMAGLLAARVLADAFTEVLVVDRDALTEAGAARDGLPQGRHAHVLLARGQQILEELFPGFADDTAAAGIPSADIGQQRWHVEGQRLAPASTGLRCVSASRPVLDSLVIARVRALPAVRFLERTAVLGVVADPDSGRVLGVRVSPAESGADDVIEADLVVDATGRNSRAPLWLAELGFQPPREDRRALDLACVTRQFRLPDKAIADDALMVSMAAAPGHPRGALCCRVEEGRWVLTLTGILGQRPPAELEGFREWARSLPAPDIYQAVRDAHAIDDPVCLEFEASQWRRYELLDRLPERLLVLGDAVCSLNPVYGQGITVAAQQALALREHLQHGIPQSLVFQKEVSGVIDGPWGSSGGGDLEFWGVEAERPEDVAAGAAFTARLRQAATRDPVLAGALLRVTGLVDPPRSLMTPDIVARALGPAPRPAP